MERKITEENMRRPLMIVSNRLPVTVGETIKRSSGGLISAIDGIDGGRPFQWIGWAGGNIEDEVQRRSVEEELKRRFSFHPIFLKPREIKDYYTGFANSSLWPLLHYQPGYAQYNTAWFAMYERVNGLFAEKIAAEAASGQLVWIHDYHLMLLPAMLRSRRPDLQIGFFLHTPFPSYEIFRCHPNRVELLEGLLGADLIGFHTSGYLRHFRSTMLRLLGIESEINTIPTESHNVTIGVFPISIPIDKFEQQMQSASFKRYLQEYRSIYADKRIVLSVERLDYSKGVPRRLDAIERFLKESGRQDVVFIFISVPSRENVSAYRELRQEIELRVTNINGQFATITGAPIHFIHQSIGFSELCALYKLADVAMVTPEIDGMNLVAKEYIACQDENEGALILSEFAGAAQELHQAYLVNPYDIDRMAHALGEALDASASEKHSRMKPMRERIKRYHARRWAAEFIETLQQVSAPHHGFMEPGRLHAQVLRDFWTRDHAALFLDYDGTLMPLHRNPADAVPDAAVRNLFEHLQSAMDRVDIYLTSGRSPAEMERLFGDYGFHLIAEHGLFYKHPTAGEWVKFDNNADLGWMSRVEDILQQYSDMTPGSEVESKTASLVWHYRNSDPEF
ncbi:MAG: bifunctional alpha,alpha-trehalose-phosphate synthase (UDP-forming)/trehalose-phosphatase, partial [Desulfosarcinaceae bacterium]